MLEVEILKQPIDLTERQLSFFFFSFVSDVFICTLITGSKNRHDCSSYEELELAGIEVTCQQIVNGTGQNWLKIKRLQCHHGCNLACSHFAFCLEQTSHWWEHCMDIFSQLGYYQLNKINMTAVRNNDLSYHFQVTLCSSGSAKFAIKITVLNSGSGENGLCDCTLIVFIQRFSHTFLIITDLMESQLTLFRPAGGGGGF